MEESERMKRTKWRGQIGSVEAKLGSFHKRTRTALIVCSINIGIGLYVFHFLYTPLYIFQFNNGVLENWHEQKLKEAKQVVLGKPINSTLLREEAGMLSRVLESHWVELSEELGFWIPIDVDIDEHEDKPDDAPGFEEEEILPGRELPRACHAELHSHYDGAAITWGPNYHKQSAFECCQACYIQAKRAAPGQMKCNVWVYCPSVKGCFLPDAYQHQHMECWLKYAENPSLNFKDKYPESYREANPGVPVIVPWVSGIVNF